MAYDFFEDLQRRIYLEEMRKKDKEERAKRTTPIPYSSDSNRFGKNEAKFDDDDDIAPVRTTTKSKKDEEEDDGLLDFFKKSSVFDDGWDAGDLTMSIVGTAGDAALNVAKGFGGVVEGVTDLAGYGAAYVGDKLGKNKWATDLRERTKESYVDKLTKPAEDVLDHYSILGRTSDAILQGVGQVGTIMATGGMASGLGKLGATAVTSGLMGVSGTGSGMSEAYQNNATDKEAFRYGVAAGASDALWETVFGGMGKAINAVGFSTGLSSLDDIVAKGVSKFVKGKTGQNIAEFLVKSGFEGLEEVGAGITQAAAKKLTYMSEEEFGNILKDENLLEQFIVGAATSGVMQSGLVPGMNEGSLKEANKTGRDFISGLTDSEQKVIDKVVQDEIAQREKKGEKVSGKEKSKIYESVIRDMDKGYISIDTIEEVLGGDTYATYKNRVSQEDALKKEFDELNNKKISDLTGVETTRKEDLRKILENIKKKDARTTLKAELDKVVGDQLLGSRLRESYNERAREYEDFQINYSSYATLKHHEAAKKTIDSAVKLGVNNTNRMHDIVDMAAKLSGDTGIVFNFKSYDNIKAEFIERQTKEIAKLEAIEDPTFGQQEKLKILKDHLAKVQSGAIIVNGANTGKEIDINLDSVKALDRLVGHEVTHSLEKAKSYDALKKHILAYAKTKGMDIDSEIKSRSLTYEGVNKADPEAELVADLVGDFLFNDTEYIRDLATNDRNLFQRIYDEVKHLLSLATAGSKEARQLERVKHDFEKAYRETSKKQADKKYHVSENFVTEIDKTLRDEMNKASQVKARDFTPEILVKNGVKDLPMLITQRHVKSVIYTESEAKKMGLPTGGANHYHGLGKDLLVKAIDNMDDPLAVYKQNEDHYLVITEMQNSNGDNIIIPVKIDGKGNYNDVYIDENQIKSVYGKKNLDDYLTRNNYQKIYEKKGTALNEGVQFSNISSSSSQTAEARSKQSPLNQQPVSTDNVAQEEGNVKYSLSDSSGRQLSKEQQEYFKDSAIRDKDGNLMVLYHGTQNAFTVFDIGRSGENYDGWSEYGEGIYLTPEKKTAQYYGDNAGRGREVNLMEMYADIKNPFSTNDPVDFDISDLAQKYELTEFDERFMKKHGNRLIEFLNHHNESVRDYLTSKGFDGVWETIDGDVYQVIAYAENQVKNVDNTSPTEDPDIRFSLSEAVEETKDLVALHNLTTDKLLKSLELGGMPMPSIAITKADIPHSNFGEITLIFGRETIDPKANRKNKAYSADAWTPTFPRVEYEADSKVGNRISQKLSELGGRIDDYFQSDLRRVNYGFEDYLNSQGGEEGLIRHVMDNYGLKAAYLEEHGKHIEKVMKQEEAEKSFNPAHAEKYQKIMDILGVTTAEEISKVNLKDARDNHGAELEAVYPGITKSALRMGRVFGVVQSYVENKDIGPVYKTVVDGSATKTAVDNALDAEGYEAWVRNLFAGIVKDSGIYNNKDLFTPSGNRRSFKQTHLPVTLENIVKAMASQNDGKSKNVSGFNGIKTLRAATAETFKSVEQMHQRKGRLQNRTQEEADALNDALQSRLFDIMQTIDNEGAQSSERNPYIRLDSIGETLTEIGESGKYNVADIQRTFQQYGKEISDDTALAVKQLLFDVTQMPVNIFESKPQRVVSFDEAKVFVIPNNADVKLKQELLNRGYSIAEYDPNIEGDRQKVVNQFEEYKFSMSDDVEVTNTSRALTNEDIAPIRRSEAFGSDFFKKTPPVEDIAPVAISETETTTEESSVVQSAKPTSGNQPAAQSGAVTSRIRQKITNAQTELDNVRQHLDQTVQYYDEEIASARAELEGKKNQNTKVAQTLKKRIERLTRLKADIEADYNARTSRLEKRIERLSSQEYVRAEHRREKQSEYTKMWENLIGDTSTWKDMPLGLQYKTKTLRRILRNVVRNGSGLQDIKRADAIYDELEAKYDHHEAQLKVESRKLKETFKKMNLTHEEDIYAQMLGELRHNPETDLTEDVVRDYYNKHRKNIDSAKVDNAIAETRKLYDDLIVRVNEVLRQQGMKEIPYRQGYFPHFTNPKQNWLAKALNWKTIDTEIPTSIAGLTQDFKPQRSWQSFAQQRRGDTTDYSLYQGLDTYIHGALDWIYHIEDLQKRRALENYIRYVHSDEGVQKRIDEIKAQDYDADTAQEMINAVLAEHNNPLGNLVRELMNRTNTLANKKSSMDREMEEKFNRKVYSTMTNINNRVTSNMVVGSLSSALTNFIPMVQSWHQVSPVYTVRGLRDMIRSTIRDDGTIAKSDFLTNRLMEEENLYQTGWDKVIDKAAFMMDAVDNITAQTVWRSKYLQNLHEGMSEAQAIKDADQFAKNLIAGRSRGNAPTIFDAKNPFTKIFTAFQLEVANQYGYMFDDVPKDSKNDARLVKGYATAFLGAYVYNALYSALVGRNAAFDPLSIIEDLLKGMFGDDEEEPEEVLFDLGENILEQVPFVGGLIGGGRIPISSAIPYSGSATPLQSLADDVKAAWNEGNMREGDWKGFTNEMLKPLYYLVSPVAGGQIKKTVEGLSMFSDEHPIAGSYTKSGKLRFPVEDNLGSKVQAALFGQYASKNARHYFDNDLAPLGDKQIQEYADSGMTFKEYHKYRNGMKDLKKQAEKVDYINGLDLTAKQKNVLKSYLFDEETYKEENPEKYNFLESEGIGYIGWKELDEEAKESWSWAFTHQDEYRYLKENGVSPEDYSVYRIPMLDFDDEGDAAYQWAYDNPEKASYGKAFGGGVKEYRKYASALSDIKSDEGQSNRKEKVINYLNGLNIDYGLKMILLRSIYSSKADKKEYDAAIIEYLNSRDDISYDDKEAILTELDITIYWD